MLASRGVCVGGHPKPASGSETSRVVRGVLFHLGETADCAAPPDGCGLIEVQRTGSHRASPFQAMVSRKGCGGGRGRRLVELPRVLGQD